VFIVSAVYCENHTEHTDTVHTSQKTHYVSATEPDRLMLFGKTVAVYCENHTEHINTLWGQNAEFPNVKADDTYDYHSLRGTINCVHMRDLSFTVSTLVKAQYARLAVPPHNAVST
jgi:hypothetical protein